MIEKEEMVQLCAAGSAKHLEEQSSLVMLAGLPYIEARQAYRTL